MKVGSVHAGLRFWNITGAKADVFELTKAEFLEK
jgi:hypothetical protein